MEEEFYDLSSFAVAEADMEGLSLLDTVRTVKPNILIGLSACGGLFSQEILEAMNENEAPPIIFPLSNPTSRSECTAAQAQARCAVPQICGSQVWLQCSGRRQSGAPN